MNFEECQAKIDKHLSKDNLQPLIIDVQNYKDLSDIITHYNVGTNKVIKVSEYCNKDQLPRLDVLYNDLKTKSGTYIVTELTSFLKLHGEKELRKVIGEILSITPAGRVIVVTYQCKKYLEYNDYKDIRIQPRILILEGDIQAVPEIIFLKPGLNHKDILTTVGIENLASSVESSTTDKIYLETEKEKENYPNAIYHISEIKTAYDALLQIDPKTSELNESIGTVEQWNYALGLFENNPKWTDIIDSKFYDHNKLGLSAHMYKQISPDERWLYFVGLKLFGEKTNWCLNYAANISSDFGSFIRNIYHSILDKSINDSDFWDCYVSRKNLLNQIGNPSSELTTYCMAVGGKRKEAICYLTDNTTQEKEAIFLFLDMYGQEYKLDELMKILARVYPDLSAYLQPYQFKNEQKELLYQYIQDYKYQKVINKLLPEFEKTVQEQADNREYNSILQPRHPIVEKLDKTDSVLYFMDAMGIEYLGFIVSFCRELNLKTNITVCKCELPSITSLNKEFLEFWEDDKTFKVTDIDEIKHKGKYGYDYSKSKLPLHLIKEIDTIKDTLVKIREKFDNGEIQKAVMIADHGASRLAVINNSENIWEMPEKGEYSGRFCKKSDIVEQPNYATDAGDFWVLANYDRFKGSRKANVEVHGGATLEEICVPIIELTYSNVKVRVCLMAADANSVNYSGTTEIKIGRNKKASVKLFITAELKDISIEINGKRYSAVPLEEKGFYKVDMPDLRKGTYSLDVYSGDNMVEEKLPLIVKPEGIEEKELL